ncbi:MAG: AAA family ATPase [Candidatus Aenigmatarchaeota archaeon]|nr:MAG: AAA family ATPase [Candidatus Aenigmarchaeota archaeon]RLJ09123.1 MAG: AAA family ATPase [Candidatus Aenigmarchaeota archaeon]
MKNFSEEKIPEFVAKFRIFLDKKYSKEIIKCGEEGKSLVIDFSVLDKFSPELGDLLLEKPDEFFETVNEVMKEINPEKPLTLRVKDLPESVNIRDLRAKHIGKFISVEGVVRKASEIRPEIVATIWECGECGDKIKEPVRFGFIRKPWACNCGNRKDLKQIDKEMIDMRWIVIEEPFELTEGEKPSQVTVRLTDELVSPEGRRMTDPGNRLKITGILREIPKGKQYSVKLDFYMEANHVEPKETGWEKLEITKEDEKKIKELAKREDVYDMFVDSLAPSLYGLREVKESIILQLFGGVPRKLKDGTHFRGDIHILLIGDPASGKSQLLKLVPEIVPRGKYVSGKGVTGAGLTATVTKDEQFMGGWVLEAGALVLANKGLLSVDEFEKMSADDQVAMHEALEQGSISIAKASIVATLPAKTSVLAGGNPKFSRFDTYLPISKQINIPETLLSRFDLKFALRDVPDSEKDKKIVEHVLRARQDEDYEEAKPKLEPEFIRKYIAYAKEKCLPELSEEAGKILKRFYIKTRKKAEGVNMPIPITLRQFEALMRLAEASAKIQLSDTVRKEDAQRAIKLMRFSLRQLGFDPETGQIDVDRAEGATTTSSERSKIKIVLDIINELSAVKKEVKIEDIEALAKKEGVEEVDEILEKLKREGMLFEPTPGYVQKV